MRTAGICLLFLLSYAEVFGAFMCGAPLGSGDPTAQEPQAARQLAKSAREPLGVFAPILKDLRDGTRVPIVLPTYLPTEGESPLYAIAEKVEQDEYVVQLAFTKDCSGGSACHFGFVSGKKSLRPEVPRGAKAVKLAGNLKGYFLDAKCGANCSDSVLLWMKDGYLYSIGLKAESIDVMTKVAESAIEKSKL